MRIIIHKKILRNICIINVQVITIDIRLILDDLLVNDILLEEVQVNRNRRENGASGPSEDGWRTRSGCGSK